MKRVTKLSVKKLSVEELNTLLEEIKREKKNLMDSDRANKSNFHSGRINTMDNQIAVIKDELNNRK